MNAIAPTGPADTGAWVLREQPWPWLAYLTQHRALLFSVESIVLGLVIIRGHFDSEREEQLLKSALERTRRLQGETR